MHIERIYVAPQLEITLSIEEATKLREAIVNNDDLFSLAIALNRHLDELGAEGF